MIHAKKNGSNLRCFARSLACVCILYVGVCFSETPVQAGVHALTAGNLTVQSGLTGTIDVKWTSNQFINYLNTQFVIRTVTGSAAGAIFTTVSPGVPLMPPITDSNYVFFGNSSALTAGGNPASVGMDAWTDDSYFLVDMTDDGLDYLQNGSRLWTTLTISGIAPGTYRLHLLSSEYDYSTTGGTAVSLTDSDLSGGLITVTNSGGNGAVPEPSSMVIFGLCVAATTLRVKRRQQVSKSHFA